jgi:hypothetical protein
MIDNKTIELIKPTPELHKKECIYMAKALQYALQYSNYIFTLIIFFSFDYFYAIASFLMGIIIVGIIRSKLRNSAVPPKQREYQYNDEAISTWFVSEYYCIET